MSQTILHLRKGHLSPKTKPSPLQSNGVSHTVEFDDYDVEPRRAGSQPPEQSDFRKVWTAVLKVRH